MTVFDLTEDWLLMLVKLCTFDAYILQSIIRPLASYFYGPCRWGNNGHVSVEFAYVQVIALKLQSL
jgi:hypothetical protein